MSRSSSLPAALLSVVLVATGLAALAPSAAHAARSTPRRPAHEAFTTGRVVVRYHPGTTAAARRAIRHAAGATRNARIPALDAEVVSSTSPDRAIRRLQARREVLWAEPEVLATRFAEVATTAERRELALDQALAADPRFDGAGARVAVIDDGVFPVADLAGRVVDRGDCSGDVCRATGGVNALTDPGFGSHGTAVAAVVAAAAGNGTGIVGAAPRATIWSYRVFPDITAGASDVSIANAIVKAADDGADVANLSLGTPFDSSLLRDAVAYARRTRPDMVIVAASGNDGGARPSYPAGSPTVLSVGATTQGSDGAWRVALFSTRADVDVLAPGQSIRTWHREPTADNPLGLGAPTGLGLVEGTSFAAPQVAGIVAGLAGAGVRGDRARAAVVASAEPALAVPGVPAAASGAGRADALTALRLATGTTSYSALFVDNGGFVARDVGRRTIETLRFDAAPGAGADGPAPLRVESGGGQLTAASAPSSRTLAGGTLVRATHVYAATGTAADEVRLLAGAVGDDGAATSLRLVQPTAGPEGVPATSGVVAEPTLTFEADSSYVRTVTLTAGQVMAVDFAYASIFSDVAAAVWEPPTAGGVARPGDAPDALESGGAASGVWIYTAPRTGTYAYGLVAFSQDGDGRHRVGAYFPVTSTVTAPARVLAVDSPATVPISWQLVAGATPVPARPGGLRWDVALQTVSRDRLGRVVVSAPRVVAADVEVTSMRLLVGSVGRYRVQVRPVSSDGPAAPWSAAREVLVLPLRQVG